MKYPRKFDEVPEVSDSSRCLVFFMDTVWIVGPLGQAIKVINSVIWTLVLIKLAVVACHLFF